MDMMPTLRALIGRTDVGVTAMTGADGLDRRIRWVATSELPDPTPFLEGGELVLTTGMRLPRTAAGCEDYVERLVTVGVVGLGVGVGVVHEQVPPRLVRAAEAAGLVLLEVDRPTPFIAVSKAVSDLIAAEEYAGVTRAHEAGQRLTRSAVTEGSPGVVRALAGLLDAWVLLLDGRGDVRHAHPRSARTRARAVKPDLERMEQRGLGSMSTVDGGEHVSLHPLGAGARHRGFLVVGRSATPSQHDRSVTGTAAALLSYGLEQAVPGPAARRRDRALVDLVRAVPDVDADVLAALGPGVLAEKQVCVLAVAGPSGALAAWVEALAARVDEDCLLAHQEGEAVVVLGAATPEGDVLRTVEDAGLRAGVAAPVAPAAVAEGIARAERALALADDGHRVLREGEAAGGVLGLVDPDRGRTLAAQVLAPLDSYADRTGIDLRETLAVWLRHHGQYDPAAVELGVHRHTLRHRVRRAEELLERPLDTAEARVELWLALHLPA